jgi:glycosyl transferase, family 25
MISALLINLDKSKDRLNFQKQQLEQLQIPMRRLAAIQSIDFNAIEYENLANGWQRKLRTTEVACFLSHMKAWQYVLETRMPWLILEDDALLSQKIFDILNALPEKTTEIDYINLETRYRRKWIGKEALELVDEYQLRRLYQDRNGSAAYVLFPSGAEKLLNRAKNSSPALADAFISQSYELHAWQIYPAAAIQLDQCENYGLDQDFPFVSTITPVNNPRPNANSCFDYCRFKFRRIAGQIRMGKRQLEVYKIAEYIHVPVHNSDYKI